MDEQKKQIQQYKFQHIDETHIYNKRAMYQSRGCL